MDLEFFDTEVKIDLMDMIYEAGEELQIIIAETDSYEEYIVSVVEQFNLEASEINDFIAEYVLVKDTIEFITNDDRILLLLAKTGVIEDADDVDILIYDFIKNSSKEQIKALVSDDPNCLTEDAEEGDECYCSF